MIEPYPDRSDSIEVFRQTRSQYRVVLLTPLSQEGILEVMRKWIDWALGKFGYIRVKLPLPAGHKALIFTDRDLARAIIWKQRF